MSDQAALQRDLRALTTAIQELTLVTRELVGERSFGAESEPLPSSTPAGPPTSKGWLLVSEASNIPGAPRDFLLRPVAIEFEEGPPDTPDFCQVLARRSLSSSKSSPDDRAREAFKAGFWVRAFWTCRIEGVSQYRPGVTSFTHWVLRKGPGFDFLRVSSQADSDRLTAAFPEIVLVEKLPTLTELYIFCAGARILVPPLWRWTGSQ